MLGPPDFRREPLHVLLMAIALAAAAFLGAISGLIWQSAGLGQADDDGAPVEQAGNPEAG